MRFSLVALLSALSLASCQQTPTSAEVGTPTPSRAAPAANQTIAPAVLAPTPRTARAAVARFVQGQPNADRYLVDSARCLDLGSRWQVLVPRTDWAGRQPDKAAFEVDKASATVTAAAVK